MERLYGTIDQDVCCKIVSSRHYHTSKISAIMLPNKTCIITGLGKFLQGFTVDEELQAISSCKGRGNQLSSRMELLIGYLIRSFSPKHVQMNGTKWSKGLKCYVCVCGVGGITTYEEVLNVRVRHGKSWRGRGKSNLS